MSISPQRLPDYQNGSHTNRYFDLEHRLEQLEQQSTKQKADAGLPDMVKMAETSFNTVLAADKHQDEKAGRVLSAMAFLTSAAATIYAQARVTSSEVLAANAVNDGGKSGAVPAASTPNTTTASVPPASSTSTSSTLTPFGLVPGVSKPNVPATAPQITKADTTAKVGVPTPPYAYYRSLFGIDLPLTTFAFYIFFVLLGSALYFAALGPSLNKPKWFVNRDRPVKSLIFFDFIDRTPIAVWRKYWLRDPNNPSDDRKSAGDLQRELFENYVTEAYIISGKVSAKLEWMSLGSLFFKGALISLALLATTLTLPVTRVTLTPNFFTSYRNFFVGLFLGAAGLSAIFAYEVARRRSMKDAPTSDDAHGDTLEGISLQSANEALPRHPLASEKSQQWTVAWLGLAAFFVVLSGIALLRL